MLCKPYLMDIEVKLTYNLMSTYQLITKFMVGGMQSISATIKLTNIMLISMAQHKGTNIVFTFGWRQYMDRGAVETII